MDPNACYERILELSCSLNIAVAAVRARPSEADRHRVGIATDHANLAEAAVDLREWLNKGGFPPSMPHGGWMPAEAIETLFETVGYVLANADALCSEVYHQPVRRIAWSRS